LLIANLVSFYNDPNLSFTVSSHTDVDGNLVVVVNVLGFSTSTSATTSHDLISGGGLHLLDSSFSFISATASTPGISCSMGFSTTDSSDVCSDTDACLTDSCTDEGNDAAVCLDAVAPEIGWSCTCTLGWEDNLGTCRRVPCGNPTQTNYVIESGTSVFESTRTVSCATGYTGTATDIACQADGTWTTSAGCTIVSCGTPVAGAGYTLGSGSTTYGSSYSMTCATGYSGTAAALTCQSSGSWTAQTGCTIVSCPSSPTQTGYTIATGSSTYGSTRTVSCASGYSGTASSITCQSSGSWTSSTGCSAPNGSSSSTPGTSCAALYSAGVRTDGTYWLTQGGTPYQAYCGMTMDGGGWTKVGNLDWSQVGWYNLVNQVRQQALMAENASGEWRVSDSSGVGGLFVKDQAPIWLTTNAWCGGYHFWQSTNRAAVQCKTSNSGSYVAMPRQSWSCCNVDSVGYHTCGYGNNWILLHSGATSNWGGDPHPCPVSGQSGGSGGLNVLWRR